MGHAGPDTLLAAVKHPHHEGPRRVLSVAFYHQNAEREAGKEELLWRQGGVYRGGGRGKIDEPEKKSVVRKDTEKDSMRT